MLQQKWRKIAVIWFWTCGTWLKLRHLKEKLQVSKREAINGLKTFGGKVCVDIKKYILLTCKHYEYDM